LADRQKKARLGEDLVMESYQKLGWVILARNYRRPGTEIDLIAQNGSMVAFIEVKWRKKAKDLAENLLPERKKRALLKGSSLFLSEHPKLLWDALRFDLAVVHPDGSIDLYDGLELGC
jgi:Holliday junction resolvase-like predicted endonuclease